MELRACGILFFFGGRGLTAIFPARLLSDTSQQNVVVVISTDSRLPSLNSNCASERDFANRHSLSEQPSTVQVVTLRV